MAKTILNCLNEENYKNLDSTKLYLIRKNYIIPTRLNKMYNTFVLPSKCNYVSDRNLNDNWITNIFKALSKHIREYTTTYLKSNNIFDIFRMRYLNKIIENIYDKSKYNIINYMDDNPLVDAFEISLNRMLVDRQHLSIVNILNNITDKFIINESNNIKICNNSDYKVDCKLRDLILNTNKASEIKYYDVDFNDSKENWYKYIKYNVFIAFIDYLKDCYKKYLYAYSGYAGYMLNDINIFWCREGNSINTMIKDVEVCRTNNKKYLEFTDKNIDSLISVYKELSDSSTAKYLNDLFISSNRIQSTNNKVFEDAFGGIEISEKIKTSFENIVKNINIMNNSCSYLNQSDKRTYEDMEEFFNGVHKVLLDYKTTGTLSIELILKNFKYDDNNKDLEESKLKLFGSALRSYIDELKIFDSIMEEWIIGATKLSNKYLSKDSVDDIYKQLKSPYSISDMSLLTIDSEMVTEFLQF